MKKDEASPVEPPAPAKLAPLTDALLLEEVRQSLNLIIVPLLIIAGCCVGAVLVWAEDILVPFVISVFFTYLLRPLVDFLSRPLSSWCAVPFRPRAKSDDLGDPERQAQEEGLNDNVESTNLLDAQGNRVGGASTPLPSSLRDFRKKARVRCGRMGALQVPRWMAILLSMLLVMALFVGLVVLVIDAMQSFENENLAAYEERTMELTQSALRWLKRFMNVDGSYMLAQVQNEFHLVQMTKSLLIILMNAVAYTFIVMLFVLYMLFEGAANPSQQQAEQAGQRNANSVRSQIDTQIQRYLVTKTGISAIVGGLTFLVLGPLLHVKMAHLFGVVTFLANFIPNVGAVIATLLPLPVVMLDPSLSGLSVVLAFVLPTTIHTVVGNIVEPIFFGQQMELHPIVVLLSLSFWFSLWGVAGALLSVPITAVMRIVFSNIAHPYAQFAKNLLEGRLPGQIRR